MPTSPNPTVRWPWAEPVLVFGLAALVRLIHLGHQGFYDEYYHLLAARNFVDSDGLPAIEYGRAALFTRMVAASIGLFGDHLSVARLPSLLAGSALVTVVFVAGRRLGGPIAGRVSALLLCFDPLALMLSQLSRFYSVQALAFVAGSLALYRATLGSIRSIYTWLYLAGAAVGIVVALALGFNTMMGVIALAVWLLLEVASARWRRMSARARWLSLLVLLASGVALLFVLPVESLLRNYSSAPQFMEPYRSDAMFYVRMLLNAYPVFVAVAPIALLVDWKSDRRFTYFAIVVFGVALLLHSGAGRKSDRYLFYAWPFVHMILGLAAAAGWPEIRRLTRGALAVVSPARRLAARLAGVLVVALAASVPLTLVFANPAYRVSLGMVTASTQSWPAPGRFGILVAPMQISHQPSNWEAARATFETLAAHADVVVASAGVKALYHLARLDVDLLATVRAETPSGDEFDLDFRTRRPVISSAESVARLVAENGTGLVIVEEVHWRQAPFVPAETADFLEQHLERVEVPDGWRFRVFRWPSQELGGER